MEEIGRAVERLLTNETLTADVDDAAARALLQWGEEQVKAGRPEEAVHRSIHTLGQVISNRATLDPAAARARLAQAGLAADDAALALLWARPLSEGEWAQRLLHMLVPNPVTRSPHPPASSPAPAPTSPSGEGTEIKRPANRVTWWRRLFSRRAPL